MNSINILDELNILAENGIVWVKICIPFVLSHTVDIATVVGTIGTVLFGFLTFRLSVNSNRLQDVIATTNSFSSTAFSGCRIIPKGKDLPVDTSAMISSIVSILVIDGKVEEEWYNADYILVFDFDEPLPLHVVIEKIDSIQIEVCARAMEFFCNTYALIHHKDKWHMFIPLKQVNSSCEKDNCINRLYILRHCCYPWYPMKKYRNAKIVMEFSFKNLGMKKKNLTKLKLEVLVRSLMRFYDPPTDLIGDTFIFSKRLNIL